MDLEMRRAMKEKHYAWNEFSVVNEFSEKLKTLYYDYCVFMTKQIKTIIEKISKKNSIVSLDIQLDSKHSNLLISIQNTKGLSPLEIKEIKFDNDAYLVGEKIFLYNRVKDEKSAYIYLYIWEFKKFQQFKACFNANENWDKLPERSFIYLKIEELYPFFCNQLEGPEGNHVINYNAGNFEILKNRFRNILKETDVKKLTFLNTILKG